MPTWIKDNRDVAVRDKNGKMSFKKIYHHSETGELRVKKYVAGKDGTRKAKYVKVPGLGLTKL
jgi:hypothetical protein